MLLPDLSYRDGLFIAVSGSILPVWIHAAALASPGREMRKCLAIGLVSKLMQVRLWRVLRIQLHVTVWNLVRPQDARRFTQAGHALTWPRRRALILWLVYSIIRTVVHRRDEHRVHRLTWLRRSASQVATSHPLSLPEPHRSKTDRWNQTIQPFCSVERSAAHFSAPGCASVHPPGLNHAAIPSLCE